MLFGFYVKGQPVDGLGLTMGLFSTSAVIFILRHLY
jgi:hypothetical protein